VAAATAAAAAAAHDANGPGVAGRAVVANASRNALASPPAAVGATPPGPAAEPAAYGSSAAPVHPPQLKSINVATASQSSTIGTPTPPVDATGQAGADFTAHDTAAATVAGMTAAGSGIRRAARHNHQHHHDSLSPPPLPPAPPTPQHAQLGFHVLVVDDERLNCKLVQRMLAALGCTSVIALDGDEIPAALAANEAAAAAAVAAARATPTGRGFREGEGEAFEATAAGGAGHVVLAMPDHRANTPHALPQDGVSAAVVGGTLEAASGWGTPTAGVLRTVEGDTAAGAGGGTAGAAIRAPPGPTRLFDLILLDIVMKRTNGAAVARQLTRSRRDAGLTTPPIVAMTANAAPADLEQYARAGMVDCLPKPFTIDGLRRVLLRALSET
jgi:CheY-like chemotaxis protein